MSYTLIIIIVLSKTATQKSAPEVAVFYPYHHYYFNIRFYSLSKFEFSKWNVFVCVYLFYFSGLLLSLLRSRLTVDLIKFILLIESQHFPTGSLLHK